MAEFERYKLKARAAHIHNVIHIAGSVRAAVCLFAAVTQPNWIIISLTPVCVSVPDSDEFAMCCPTPAHTTGNCHSSTGLACAAAANETPKSDLTLLYSLVSKLSPSSSVVCLAF